MVRCLANAILQFHNPETGEKATTKIGFNELPNWVGELPYFKAASKSWHLDVFDGSSDKMTEQLVKDEEKAAQLRDDIKALEEKKEKVLIDGNEKISSLKDEIAALEERKASMQSAGKNNNKR